MKASVLRRQIPLRFSFPRFHSKGPLPRWDANSALVRQRQSAIPAETTRQRRTAMIEPAFRHRIIETLHIHCCPRCKTSDMSVRYQTVVVATRRGVLTLEIGERTFRKSDQ